MSTNEKLSEIDRKIQELLEERTKLLKAERTGTYELSSTTTYGRLWMVRDLLKGGEDLIGRSVLVCGWVRSCRVQGNNDTQFAFVHVFDGTCAGDFQVVIDGAVFGDLKRLSTGSSVEVEGEVIKSQGRGQVTELRATKVCAVGTCDAQSYPIAKKEHTLEFLRSVGHLRPRTKILAATMRVRSALSFATHEFFALNGFQYVHTPIITASDCEGAGEMFAVTTLMGQASGGQLPLTDEGAVDYRRDFFLKPAFLTVSGQLDAEIMATALSRVYTFGPTFRAENSNTSRHAAEFWMIEPEMAFADLTDNIDVAEAYVKYCVRHVLETCTEEIAMFEKYGGKSAKGLLKRLELVRDKAFARMTYREAVEKVLKSGKKFNRKLDPDDPEFMDMGSEHERFLTENITKRPTVVTDYPKEIKAFYMRANDDGKTVAAMDILVPGIGELMGGSQREERLDVLAARIRELGLEESSYDWYLDLRRYGTVKHSGFGVGFERLIMFLTGTENIRDVIPFPRYPGSAAF